MQSRSRFVIPLVLLAALNALGCNSARQVLRDPDRGIVAIPQDSDRWPFYHRKDAEAMMEKHFPAGYVIEREEEVVVGQTTNYKEGHPGGTINLGLVSFGLGKARGKSTTGNETEYRIHYRRQDAPIQKAVHVQPAAPQPGISNDRPGVSR